MNKQIRQENWAAAFEELSKLRYRWMTTVKVLDNELGEQTLFARVPLNGITVEKKGKETTINIAAGATKNMYENHRIVNPTSVTFLESPGSLGDVIHISQEDGTKTLIQFVEPMGLLLGFQEMVMAAATGA